MVDDEALVRWSVAETLASLGYRVAEAADAESTVRALLEDGPPDLVLLDLKLPDCVDLALFKTVRRVAPDVPIILMTAFGSPEMLDEARALGAFTVLEKPFDVNELDGLITRALHD